MTDTVTLRVLGTKQEPGGSTAIGQITKGWDFQPIIASVPCGSDPVRVTLVGQQQNTEFIQAKPFA